ncbi:hypothetical protein C2G38_2270618 [Gigaspora rosea]|uniref:Uncharacterized protein n=1 Tax=Gigaspora rosea TaxID=44941 RepID=A0A397UNC4_9GLOM|nr:hypothetical protein C2G38_2270618 [Gigaspora rosea]
MEAMFRVWTVFFQYQRKHYNKLPLMFLSDVFYWFSTNHPILQTLTESIHVFNNYYIENFHSSLRQQIHGSNMADQIIQEAQIIDQMHGNNSFMNVFAESHNIRYSARQLEYLEKCTTLFLLKLFTDVYRNLGGSKIISFDEHTKPKKYEFPILKTENEIDILPMAWNTSHIPHNDRCCDLEDCIDSCEVGLVLICGHAYHYECFFFKLESQCQYCIDYLSRGIKKNCKAFQKTLESLDKKAKAQDLNKQEATEDIESDDNTSDENFF